MSEKKIKEKKKITVYSELVFIAAIITMAFSVSITTIADFGISMIVAPAYLVSQILGITFGQGEYIVQGLLFIAFCIIMKRFRVIYLFAFITGLIYGFVLDLWRLVPAFNESITPSESIPMWLRIIYLLVGMVITSIAVALFFRTYIYPQVYDFFVKEVPIRYGLNRNKFKIAFDFSCLAVTLTLAIAFFYKDIPVFFSNGPMVLLTQSFHGIGIGTIIMTAFNGLLIGAFSKFFDEKLEVKAIFPKIENYFNK